MAARKHTWKHFALEAAQAFSDASPKDPVVAALSFKAFYTDISQQDLPLPKAYELLDDRNLIAEIVKGAENSVATSFQATVIRLLQKLVSATSLGTAVGLSLGSNLLVGGLFYEIGLQNQQSCDAPKNGVSASASSTTGPAAPLAPPPQVPVTGALPGSSVEERPKRIPFSSAPPYEPKLGTSTGGTLGKLSASEVDEVCRGIIQADANRMSIGQPQLQSTDNKDTGKSAIQRAEHSRHPKVRSYFQATP